ncbi:MAG: type I pullulanase [Ktedonobacteraceae bacterium]
MAIQTEVAIQTFVSNAYLESATTILAALSAPIILPCRPEDVTILDSTTGQTLAVTAAGIARTFQPTLVGDFQHIFSTGGDWNTTDPATRMEQVHANLYQMTAALPAGNYQYKIVFDGVWDGAFPDMNVNLTVPQGGLRVTFSFVPYDLVSHKPQLYDSINHMTAKLPTSDAGASVDLLKVTLSQAPDITHTLQMSLRGTQPQTVIARSILHDPRYIYTGDDLGNTFTAQETTFRLWAPTAADVQLLLYETETGPQSQQVAMQRAEQGTWHASVHMPLANWYYLYQVSVQGQSQTVVDPYVTALAPNATRGMIVDMAALNPEHWADDHYRPLAHPVDAVIYETHVRDFSIMANSGMSNKGRYLAYTERGTTGPQNVSTGVDSLLQLGITHVQVLPVFDFASVDETKPDQYNWGYDPRTYNVPQGAYATTPHGAARINEYKRMIQSLHASGIGVIMDVVYNHTFAIYNSAFDLIVPHYYYRTDDYGHYSNGSGCGNEVATERPMVRKFVLDSLKYWVREYHVDGFRFDLMALLGVDTMRAAAHDVHALNPDALVYGEPWTGGLSTLPSQQIVYKGRQKELGLGVFNDNIRNGLIGSVFDHSAQGFAMGAPFKVDVIKRGVQGSIHDFTAAPGETINYVSSHDNLTLWDKIIDCCPRDSEADRIKMDELAQAVILTSQGVPFLQGGEEFLRTKSGNDNSYNAGDAINQFDWERKATYQPVFSYYAELIQLRREHPAFRMTTPQDIDAHLAFLDSAPNTVAFTLGEHANGDPWKSILVLYNPNRSEVSFNLPAGEWTLVCSQTRAAGSFAALPISCTILYQE